MAKFCNQCGKPLQEGEVCSCQNPEVAQNSEPVNAAATENAATTVNYTAEQVTRQMQETAQAVAVQGANVFKKMIDIFKSPISTVKQIADAQDKAAAFSMVITNVLVLSIITLIACVSANSKLDGWFEIPVAKMVLTVLLTSAGVDFALAACLWLTTKFFFKEEVSFIKMLSVTGAKLLIDSVFIVVGSILAIVSAEIGMMIFVLGSLFTMVLFIQSYAEVSSLSKDKKFYAMTVALAIFAVVVVVFVSLCLKDAMDNLKSITDML